MWIEELDNGKFKYVERYTDPVTDKQKRVSITLDRNTSHSRKEAQRILDEKIEKALSNFRLHDSISFEKVYKQWYKVHCQQVKESTARTTAHAMKSMLEVFGDVSISDIKSHHINQYFLVLQTDGALAYSTVRRVKNIFDQTYRFACEMGYVPNSNLLNEIMLRKINMTQTDEFKYLERDEFKSTIEQLSKTNESMARFAFILGNTGMRYGELAGLFEEDINFEESQISINRRYYEAADNYDLPKNGKKRNIYVNADVLKALKAETLSKKKKLLAYQLRRDIPNVFITSGGRPYGLRNVNRSLASVKLPSGKKVTSHYFRHSFITYMLEEETPTKLIAEHVGHSNTKMIDNIYSHFSTRMNEQLKESILNLEII